MWNPILAFKGFFKFSFPSETLFLSVLPVLDQLLMELHRFLLILDKETLSGNATTQKGLLSDLLQSYRASNGMKEKVWIEVYVWYLYSRASKNLHISKKKKRKKKVVTNISSVFLIYIS